MKNIFLLATCFMLACGAEAQTNAPLLNIYSAIELDSITQTGVIYQVQNSPDLSNWTNLDLPIFGDGSEWSKTYSTRAQPQNFYRITVPSPVSNLVGFYPLNGNAYDYSGYTNNGTISGAVAATDRFGNTNGAFYFAGDGSDIEIPDSPSLDIVNAVTIAAWIKIKGGGYAQPRIVTKGVYQIGLSDTSLTPQIFFDIQPITPGSIISSPVSLYMNGWIFVAATYDGNLMCLYINGVLAAQTNTSGSIGINSHGVGIGSGNAAGGTDYFKGYIDDVRIYNRALNQSEIQQLYNLNY
jgi:hypothetical protein